MAAGSGGAAMTGPGGDGCTTVRRCGVTEGAVDGTEGWAAGAAAARVGSTARVARIVTGAVTSAATTYARLTARLRIRVGSKPGRVRYRGCRSTAGRPIGRYRHHLAGYRSGPSR